MDVAAEEGRKTSGAAFADKDFDHLVAAVAQDFFERDGLGQVSPALALDNEQVFHEAGAMVGTRFRSDDPFSNSTSA